MENDNNTPTPQPQTEQTDLQRLNLQLEKVVQEIHHAIDLAREIDERDCLSFDLDDLQDVLMDMENICNTSEGIDENNDDE